MQEETEGQEEIGGLAAEATEETEGQEDQEALEGLEAQEDQEEARDVEKQTRSSLKMKSRYEQTF